MAISSYLQAEWARDSGSTIPFETFKSVPAHARHVEKALGFLTAVDMSCSVERT